MEDIDQEEKLGDDRWKQMVKRDADERTVSEHEARIAKVSQALDVIDKYGTQKKPLLHTRKPITFPDFKKALEDERSIEEKVVLINSLSARLAELSGAINKTETLKMSLEPWREYDIPLEEQGTKTTDLFLCVAPASADVNLFMKGLEDKVPASLIQLVASDAEQHYFYILSAKTERSFIDEIFRECGFSKFSSVIFQGRSRRTLKHLKKSRTSLRKKS